MKAMEVLVTGAGGFIGSWLAEWLEQQGHTVTWLAKSKTPWLTLAKGEVIFADLCTAALPDIVATQDCIFHLAATASVQKSIGDPAAVFRNNAKTTRRLLEAVQATAATRSGKLLFVLLSSDRVYGKAEAAVVDENAPVHPTEEYAQSKLQAEQYCKEFAALGAIDYVIIRAGNIFGPRQKPELLIPSCIKRMVEAHARGEQTVPVGNTENYRNFAYVEDVVEVLAGILQHPAARNQTFNIATGHCQVAAIITMLKDIAQQVLGSTITAVPDAKLYRPAHVELPRYALDCHKAENLLKWKPRHSLRQGLEKTFRYYAR